MLYKHLGATGDFTLPLGLSLSAEHPGFHDLEPFELLAIFLTPEPRDGAKVFEHFPNSLRQLICLYQRQIDNIIKSVLCYFCSSKWMNTIHKQYYRNLAFYTTTLS